MTIQAPARLPILANGLSVVAVVGGLFGMLLGGIWGGRYIGRWLGQRGHSSAWALPFSLAIGIVWPIIFVVSLYVALMGRLSIIAPEGQDNWQLGYGYAMLMLLAAVLSLGLIPVGVTITQLSAFRMRSRSEEVTREEDGELRHQGADVPKSSTQN